MTIVYKTFTIEVFQYGWELHHTLEREKLCDGFYSTFSDVLHRIAHLSLYARDIDKITLALESAEYVGTGVQRPFYIINTKNDEVIEIK